MPGVVTAINQIDAICKDYGLYAKIIDVTDAYDGYMAGMYVVVSIKPIADSMHPYEILLRNKRNPKLLYLWDFAVRLTPNNAMVALREVLNFIKKTELMRALYQEFLTDLPDSIHVLTYEKLKHFNAGRYSTDECYKSACISALSSYFDAKKKNAKRQHKNDTRKNWIRGRKASNIVPFDTLCEVTDKLRKIEVPEELYAPFIHYLTTCYSSVTISVSKKHVVDTGLLKLSKLSKHNQQKDVRYVTAATLYDVLTKEFATKGWSCIENMEACYWEYRYVYYKAADEVYMLEAFLNSSLAFSKADTLLTLKERGPISKLLLPISQVYTFVDLAKRNHVKFHFDCKNHFNSTSEEVITVIYNLIDENRMKEILTTITKDLARYSHLLYENQLPFAPCIDNRLSKKDRG